MVLLRNIILIVLLTAAGWWLAVNIKPWVIARITAHIRSAVGTNDVSIKDVQVPISGPIEIIGLALKKGNDIELEVSTIVLDKGFWGIVNGSSGTVRAELVRIGMMRVSDINADFWWKGKDLVVSVKNARSFDGSIQGQAVIQLKEKIGYKANVHITGLSLPKLTAEMKLREKVDITGLLGGDIKIEGQGGNFKVVDGKLVSAAGGGVLLIKDTGYLAALAKRSGQSLDLVMAGLQRYQYNDALVVLALKGEDLSLGFALQGEAGKRRLDVVVHDFSLERTGQ